LTRISEQLIPSRAHIVDGQPAAREQAKRAHSPPHPPRADAAPILLAFPKAALRKLQLAEDAMPESIKVLDDHVDTLVSSLPDDREVRKAATIVRAYMFAMQMGAPTPGGGGGSGGQHSVRDDESAFRAMEQERDRLTRVVFGIEPGDDALAPGEAASKLTKVTAQYDTAKAKLIASLSQQIMNVTREVLDEHKTSSSAGGAASARPAPSPCPTPPPSAPTPGAPAQWLASFFGADSEEEPSPTPSYEKAVLLDRPITPAGNRTEIASPTSRASARLERIQL